MAAPSAARCRSRVRRHDRRRRDRARARQHRRSAGAHRSMMTTEALEASPAPTARDAGWRDIAAVIGARLLARLRSITAAIRPLARGLVGLPGRLWLDWPNGRGGG